MAKTIIIFNQYLNFICCRLENNQSHLLIVFLCEQPQMCVRQQKNDGHEHEGNVVLQCQSELRKLDRRYMA